MDTFRVGDDLPIESKAVTDTLDKVQEKVENYYANIRQKVRRCMSALQGGVVMPNRIVEACFAWKRWRAGFSRLMSFPLLL